LVTAYRRRSEHAFARSTVPPSPYKNPDCVSWGDNGEWCRNTRPTSVLSLRATRAEDAMRQLHIAIAISALLLTAGASSDRAGAQSVAPPPADDEPLPYDYGSRPGYGPSPNCGPPSRSHEPPPSAFGPPWQAYRPPPGYPRSQYGPPPPGYIPPPYAYRSPPPPRYMLPPYAHRPPPGYGPGYVPPPHADEPSPYASGQPPGYGVPPQYRPLPRPSEPAPQTIRGPRPDGRRVI